MREERCRQLLKRKTLAGILAVNGLNTEFVDDSGHMLSRPVLWSFYYLLYFPAGKWLTK